MEFFDLRVGGRADSTKPKVRTVNKSVLLSIPMALAEHVGLDGASAVRVQFGQDDESTALRIKSDEAGSWGIKRRKSLVQIYVPEILPMVNVEEQEVEFSDADGALTLTLPAPWRLANALVVRRTSMRRAPRP